jgi:MoaA/NifB/PqqE/SkfB family radical SAM enzyme
MSKPNSIFCHVPFVRAFVLPNGEFRDCCATTPPIVSKNYDFNNWWYHNNYLQKFRKHLVITEDFPTRCQSCSISEQSSGHSFRLAINKIPANEKLQYPKEWSIMFGNTCNLSCWHCSEHFSSRIESDKKKIAILASNFISPNVSFESNWPALKKNIIKSFDYHDVVTLSLLGGEPTYNKYAIELLQFLYENGYSHRTRLEITTNGTKLKKLDSILNEKNWNYIYIAISIDAVGPKAEWIRYGCKWQIVDSNIDYAIKNADYVELHLSVSVLNIIDLPVVYDYCRSKNLRLIINYLTDPSFFSLEAWDGPTIDLNKNDFVTRGLSEYYDLLGSSPKEGSYQQAKQYIKSLNQVRSLPTYIDPIISLMLC